MHCCLRGRERSSTELLKDSETAQDEWGLHVQDGGSDLLGLHVILPHHPLHLLHLTLLLVLLFVLQNSLLQVRIQTAFKR